MSHKFDQMKLTPEQEAFQVELLQTIVAFHPRRPSLAMLAREYGCSRQTVFRHVKRLREAGYLEENEKGVPEWGARITHNGKRLLERALVASH